MMNWRRFFRVLVLLMLPGAGTSAWALNPNLPPGGNFDLTHWKLTLPSGSAGSPTEISPTQLAGGFTNANFYTAADGSMTFWCPVNGVTTSGSSYPRSELREEINGLADDDAYWTIGQFPVSELTATLEVQQYPNDQSKQRVIIGQIHASGFPVLKLVYEHDKGYGMIVAQVNTNIPTADDEKDVTVASGVADLTTNTVFSYDIKTVVSNGIATLYVSVNNYAPTGIVETAWINGSNNGLYFKAGDYCQESGTNSTLGGKVAFYALSVTHGSGTPATPARFTNWGINSSNCFTMQLSGLANTNYVIQASTDLTNWTSLATNSSPGGSIGFADTNSPGFTKRYYRAFAP
jgi:hypothetical protein